MPVSKMGQLQHILAPVSLGELVDKITILRIKQNKLQGAALENVNHELHALTSVMESLGINVESNMVQNLMEVNERLWKIEDDIRENERRKVFDQNFIELARSVYKQNDMRAALKKEINIAYGSSLIEEKSYKNY